jgi:hypothetical protein
MVGRKGGGDTSNPEPVHLKVMLITTLRHPAREAICPRRDNRFLSLPEVWNFYLVTVFLVGY